MVGCLVSAPQRPSSHPLVRWLPVLIWMALIFIASSDAESGPRGSRLLTPLILWVWPEVPPPTLDQIVLVARKGVHFVTYGILAALAWRAFSSAPDLKDARRLGPGSVALCAIALAVLYAISDEIHQSFVPTRVGSALDVLIDTAGAATAVALAQFRATRRTRR